MDDSGVPRGGDFDWEGVEDLAVLSRQDLELRLESLCEEERALGYRRQVLQGGIDLIRAKLVGRGAVALPPEELVRVLLGEVPTRASAMDPGRDLP